MDRYQQKIIAGIKDETYQKYRLDNILNRRHQTVPIQGVDGGNHLHCDMITVSQ